MLTVPITNAHFRSRVLDLVSTSVAAGASGPGSSFLASAFFVVPPLGPDDTDLTPSELNPRLLGFTSPWIDLCSPDPVVADVSRQVLHMELAYAAFCGIGSVFVAEPFIRLGDVASTGLAQYARAVEQGLSLGANLGVSVVFHMVENARNAPDCALASMTRPEYVEGTATEQGQKAAVDLFGTWDAWNVVRTTCKYSSRLFAG